MIKEFVPETRSDKKDAEIARLREQVRVLRESLIQMVECAAQEIGLPANECIGGRFANARAALAALGKEK